MPGPLIISGGCGSGTAFTTDILWVLRAGRPSEVDYVGILAHGQGGHMERFVFGFDELRKEDSDKVGRKCANLSELAAAGFRVPPGFAIALDAYTRFINDTGLGAAIEDLLGSLRLGSLDPSSAANMPRYEEASAAIRQMVEHAEMPSEIASAIRSYYKSLCEATGVDSVPVAVRSAGPVSRPGQYETYLNVRGTVEVIRNVIRVWSSTFNTRSLVARARRGLSLSCDPIGVAVLKMVNARSAGVMFTVNPSDSDASKIYIESNWGLGESVVAGEVTPDSFLVDKACAKILKRTISPKAVSYVVDPITGRVSRQAIPEERRNAPTLNDDEVLELARLGRLIENHFGAPQDIEWAVDSEHDFPESIVLLQTRQAATEAQKKSPTDRIIDLMVRGISGS